MSSPRCTDQSTPPYLLFAAILQFVTAYGKKGWMRHVLNSTWDSHAVKQLDTDLAGCVGDISMTLNVAQMRMQQRTFDEVEKLATAIETQRESDDGSLSEAALQQVS